MRNFLNLKDIPVRDFKRILFDAKRRKRLRLSLKNLDTFFRVLATSFISLIFIVQDLKKLLINNLISSPFSLVLSSLSIFPSNDIILRFST